MNLSAQSNDLTDAFQIVEEDENLERDDTKNAVETSEKPAHSISDFSLHAYMKEVNSLPLLSHEETMELFQRIEEKKSALDRSKKQAVHLRRRLEEEVSAIKEKLVTSNLRLVVYLANRYQGRGIPIQDLVQEGNIGLIRAIEKFDYHLGYRFSTYATWWIRQGMLRTIHQQSRLIRIPTHMLEKFQRHMREVEEKNQEDSDEFEMDEIEGEPLSDKDLEMINLMEIMREPLSLDAPMTDDGLDLQEVTHDENQMVPEENVIEQDLRHKLRSALTMLTLKEEIILRMRYAIDLPEPHTLEEVGRIFSLTKERIRQIESRALKKLHQSQVA
jgi:RNA polymerase primary sigma factor